MMRFVLTVLLLLVTMLGFAQDPEREKIQQLQLQKEMEKARLIRQQMDSGIYLMEREQYAVADEKLKYALANMKSIPSDLTFFFGKNSYFIGKFKQSVDWLSKYLQLKGTSGQYSSEAAEWLKKAEAALVLEHQAESVKAGQVLSRDYVIDCGPNAKVVCPVCNGSTVTIKRDAFGQDKYKTCPYCNKLGYLTCDEYNQLLKGQLKAH
jgi:hypothetical protein